MDGRTAVEGSSDQVNENSAAEILTQQLNEKRIVQIVKLEDVTRWGREGLQLKAGILEANGAENDQTTRPSQIEKLPAKSTYRRVELCMADKLRVIAAGSSGMSQRQVAKQFGISKTQVQTLLKRKDEIMRRYDEGYDSWRKRTKFTKNNFEHVNELVWKWYTEKSAEDSDSPITGPMLKSKAIEIGHALGLGDEFKASNGWLECFKRRYKIQIGRKNKKETQPDRVEELTMVAIKPAQEQPRTDPPFPRANQDALCITSMADASRSEPVQEQQRAESDPKISSVYSMHGQRATAHQVHPILLPATQMPVYRQYPATVRQHEAFQSIGAEIKLSQQPEKSEKDVVYRQKLETFSDALKYASVLKAFAVERGSVTLIGLMTAMEHELEREKKNSSGVQCDAERLASDSFIVTK